MNILHLLLPRLLLSPEIHPLHWVAALRLTARASVKQRLQDKREEEAVTRGEAKRMSGFESARGWLSG